MKERGREEKINSRDLSNRVSEDRRGDRQQGSYIRTDVRKTFMKTDGETESRDPSKESLEREREI